MTLRYYRGMTLGEFQDMIAEHQAELDAGRRGDVVEDCPHPFDPAGLTIEARKAEGGVEVAARWRCKCGEKYALKRLLPYRKAKVQA